MKILFYSVNALMVPVNFGAELDLMKTHMEAGDEIYVVRCKGELQSCHTNPQHFQHKCYLCKSRFQQGMDMIGLSADRVLDMSEEGVDYSRLPARFSSLEEIDSFSLEGQNFGEAVISSMVMELKDHKFDTHEYADKIAAKLRMAYLVHVNIRRYLEQIKPDLVYVFNGRLAESKAVLNNCLALNIPVYTIDRAGTQGRFALFKNATPLSIAAWRDDFIELWGTGGEDKVKIAEEYWTARRYGKEFGDPAFTKHQKQSLLPEGFDPSKKNIGIYISSEYELAGDPERKNPIYCDQNDALVQIVESLLPHPEYKVWLRAHPHITFTDNLQLIELREIEARNYTNLGIIWPKSPVDTYALVDACDKVLTFASTVGIEATFWGKPSILAGRAYYEDLDVVYRPKSHAELMQLLMDDNLPPKDKQGALIYAHGLMTNGIPYRHFTQTTVHDGHFNGKTFEPTKQQKLFAYMLKRLDKIRYKVRQKSQPEATRQ